MFQILSGEEYSPTFFTPPVPDLSPRTACVFGPSFWGCDGLLGCGTAGVGDDVSGSSIGGLIGVKSSSKRSSLPRVCANSSIGDVRSRAGGDSDCKLETRTSLMQDTISCGDFYRLTLAQCQQSHQRRHGSSNGGKSQEQVPGCAGLEVVLGSFQGFLFYSSNKPGYYALILRTTKLLLLEHAQMSKWMYLHLGDIVMAGLSYYWRT
jgi:hypothetical protein